MTLDLCLRNVHFQFDQGLFWKLTGVYLCAVVSSWFFKRRLRGFFGKVVTAGVHAYRVEKQCSGTRRDDVSPSKKASASILPMKKDDPEGED